MVVIKSMLIGAAIGLGVVLYLWFYTDYYNDEKDSGAQADESAPDGHKAQSGTKPAGSVKVKRARNTRISNDDFLIMGMLSGKGFFDKHRDDL